ncbi:hypothetical protein HDU82_009308 [Entophlyctis luteolus]|nr:hypothetical protein HDU82_009308 [Entophlyctis luteolus]
MKPADPYPAAHNASAAPPRDYYYPRAPTTTLTRISPQPQPSKFETQAPSDGGGLPAGLDIERNRRQYENKRGVLGGTLNFDGSQRAAPMISVDHLVLAKRAQMEAGREGSGLIYFGDSVAHREQRDSYKHKPGIEAAIYTDSHVNAEKKKAIQAEMAKFERMQLAEREQKKSQQRRVVEEPPKWPFGNQHESALPPSETQFHHLIPYRAEEIALRQYEKNRAKEYAHELDTQIAADIQLRKHMKEIAPKQDDDSKWMFHHSQMPGRKPKVPLEPPQDRSTDIISHCVIANKQTAAEARKLRSKIADERKDVYPFNHDGYNATHAPTNGKSLPPVTFYSVEPTSLPIGGKNTRKTVFLNPNDSGSQQYHEPEFGRKKFWSMSSAEEIKAAEQETKLMRQIQEQELRKHREDEQRRKHEEFEQGKQEPVDKEKAQKYQSDLDALVRMRREIKLKQQEAENELWKKPLNSFDTHVIVSLIMNSVVEDVKHSKAIGAGTIVVERKFVQFVRIGNCS